jgi:hypothetical protein
MPYHTCLECLPAVGDQIKRDGLGSLLPLAGLRAILQAHTAIGEYLEWWLQIAVRY